MSVLMRRENTLIIEPGSDISKIQIINFILLPNSKKHFEGPPLQDFLSGCFFTDLQNISILFEWFMAKIKSQNAKPVYKTQGVALYPLISVLIKILLFLIEIIQFK
ncbi:Hypothetical_protein [Hexamita inflata]|uniref:Hypothetical_protein n=1 Tax=Hexamita inflata TaxID=28002 RepID=A0AA86TFS2_9EUKA|nr:Hypothetical protein HINF_LOCUS2642 [Hexamita inflata]